MVDRGVLWTMSLVLSVLGLGFGGVVAGKVFCRLLGMKSGRAGEGKEELGEGTFNVVVCVAAWLWQLAAAA